MSLNHYGGNQIPEITREEHWTQNGISGKNVYVRDSSGNIVSDFGGSGSGNISVHVMNEISALATVNVSNVIRGIVTIAPRTDYIGLMSISGNVAISNELTALATVNVSNIIGGVVTIAPRTDYIGLASVNIGGTLPALVASSAYIGLASVNIGGTLPALVAGTAQIGSVTVSNTVTVEETTSKTLLHLTIANNTSGAATIFVPTGTFKITNLMLSANATVGISIKSGVTYLAGNASIRVTVFPGGGWVENGDLLNPLFSGLADAGSFVLEKTTTTPIAGHVVYYED